MSLVTAQKGVRGGHWFGKSKTLGLVDSRHDTFKANAENRCNTPVVIQVHVYMQSGADPGVSRGPCTIPPPPRQKKRERRERRERERGEQGKERRGRRRKKGGKREIGGGGSRNGLASQSFAYNPPPPPPNQQQKRNKGEQENKKKKKRKEGGYQLRFSRQQVVDRVGAKALASPRKQKREARERKRGKLKGN